MRIRSAHACKRASENEHTGRGSECDLYPETAPKSVSGRHGCRAGAACGGGHRCSGGDGGSTNGDGGLRAASEYILSVVGGVAQLRRDHRPLGSRRGRGLDGSVGKRMTRSEAAWALQRSWPSTRGVLNPVSWSGLAAPPRGAHRGGDNLRTGATHVVITRWAGNRARIKIGL